MRLADAIGLRIGGRDAIEARLNGQVVWSSQADPLQQIIDDLTATGQFYTLQLDKQQSLGVQRLWRDAAGTLPVTASGDPVFRRDEIGPGGYHSVAPSSAARPIYRNQDGLEYLEYPGVSSALSTPSIDLSGESKITVIVAVNKKAPASFQQIIGQGNTGASQTGAWDLSAGGGAGSNRDDYTARFASPLSFSETAENLPPPSKSVIRAVYDRTLTTSQQIRIFVDGVESIGAASVGAVGGAFQNAPINHGARLGSSVFFNGDSFASCVIAANVSASLVDSIESYFASLAEVAL